MLLRRTLNGREEQRAQAEVMILIDQSIPACAFLRANRAYADTVEQFGILAWEIGDIAGHGCLFTAFAPECPVPEGT